jgi:hypothetical protein
MVRDDSEAAPGATMKALADAAVKLPLRIAGAFR